MNSDFLIIACFSYFIGSIPFAFLIVRLLYGKDIRSEGSGNVGAMNSFETTGAKWLGIVVMILDGLKGVFAVLLAVHYFGDDIYNKQVATFFAVLGHCYPVWLNFKGGRGLATTAGAIILFLPSLLISWCVVWVLAWAYSKKISFCNISATFCVILIMPIFESVRVLFFVLILASLILLRHQNVMKEAFKNG